MISLSQNESSEQSASNSRNSMDKQENNNNLNNNNLSKMDNKTNGDKEINSHLNNHSCTHHCSRPRTSSLNVSEIENEDVNGDYNGENKNGESTINLPEVEINRSTTTYTGSKCEENVESLTRFSDGSVKLRNPHIELMDQDILYHLALGSESHDLVEMFTDVKFVVVGGTPKRMEEFAYFIMGEIGHKIPSGTQLLDISRYSYRYSMYKIGPVLALSHGMGIPSVSILLHEVIKLMFHAKVHDPVFFRIGTCGGVGIDGGTVILSEEALNADLKPYQELTILGKKVRRPSKLDKRLCEELLHLAGERDDSPYDTIKGKTMCTDDFYEGQGRLDGAFCEFSEKEKMSYIHHLNRQGISNIEMESLAFATLTNYAGIRAAVICVSLLDRLKGDQISAQKEVLNEWQLRPQKLVALYIKKHLGLLTPSHKLSPNISAMLPCACPHNATMRVKSPRRMNFVQQESESYD